MADSSMPTTGVVLAALDEFSATMKAYVAGLNRVDGATQQSAAASDHAAGATRKQAEAHALGAEKMARYALGASIVSGQMQQMGISAEKVMLPMTVLFTMMTEGFNPAGAVLIGVGLLASKLVSVFTEARRLREETDKLTASLVGMAAVGGVQSEAERAAVMRDLADATTDLTTAQIALDIANKHLADGEKGYIGNFNKTRALKDQAAALKDVRDAQQRLTSDSLALAGGSDAAAKAQHAYTEAMDKRTAATTKAAAAAKALADAERKDHTAQLDGLSVAVAAHDDKLTGITATGFAVRRKQFIDSVAVQMDGFGRVNAAGTAAAAALTAVEVAEAQKRQAILQHQVDVSIQAGALIGNAIGGAIAGTTDVWRTAAVAALGIVKREIEAIITLHALITPWILVKLGAVEAIFSAASAALLGGSHAPTPVRPTGGPNYGGAANTQGMGYQGGYYYAPTAQPAPPASTAQPGASGAAPVTVTYQIHQEFHGAGDPAVQRAYTRETEDLLYRLGPEAARRAKALGRAA